MLNMKVLSKYKKRKLKNLLSPFYRLFINKKPLVVFEAYTAFHLEHFKSVILNLSASNAVNIAIIGPVDQDIIKLERVSFYEKSRLFPFHKKPDLFISTDFGRIPYWFSCTSVYFGHGIGPKLNYQASEGLYEFDYVFSPCRPIYDTQIKILPEEKILPVGLPILDKKGNLLNDVLKKYALNEKPIVLYAPSWCSDSSKISDIKSIINFLRKKNNFNIIISPHPLLFNPDRCDGTDFFSGTESIDGLHLNTPDSEFSTLDLVKASSVVLSDISSILFEAMALDLRVLFDGNKELYEYSEALDVYEEVIKVCMIPDWCNENDRTIEDIINYDALLDKRKIFINRYLFNPGQAGDIFIDRINSILS